MENLETKIPATFIRYAADILADTVDGLSGANIIKVTGDFAVDYDVDLPHPSYPFQAGNKRTALYENLMAFSPSQQYQIIKDLCDHPSFSTDISVNRRELKLRLISRYGHLSHRTSPSAIDENLVIDTRHWLDDYPEALRIYSQAFEKYRHGIFHRNMLDDLRLSLEKLLNAILGNSKSLENQLSDLGRHIKERGGSPECTNMFVKLLDYYCKYNNNSVKHGDDVNHEEIELILELTSSFMKHIARLSKR